MYKYITKITKLNDWFMTRLYIVDIIINLLYIGTLLIPGVHAPPGYGFIVFFCATSGIMIAINVMLLGAAYKKKNAFAGMRLLRIYVAVQAITIMGEIYSGIANKDFWIDGYVWIMLEVVMIVCYAYRHHFLDLTQKSLSDKGGSRG